MIRSAEWPRTRFPCDPTGCHCPRAPVRRACSIASTPGILTLDSPYSADFLAVSGRGPLRPAVCDPLRPVVLQRSGPSRSPLETGTQQSINRATWWTGGACSASSPTSGGRCRCRCERPAGGGALYLLAPGRVLGALVLVRPPAALQPAGAWRRCRSCTPGRSARRYAGSNCGAGPLGGFAGSEERTTAMTPTGDRGEESAWRRTQTGAAFQTAHGDPSC